MRQLVIVCLLGLLLPQTGCIWKLWSKGDIPIEKIDFDVYGTVETINPDILTLLTREGSATFLFGPASVKGGELKPGQTVHVFYRKQESGSIITLVVRKVK